MNPNFREHGRARSARPVSVTLSLSATERIFGPIFGVFGGRFWRRPFRKTASLAQLRAPLLQPLLADCRGRPRAPAGRCQLGPVPPWRAATKSEGFTSVFPIFLLRLSFTFTYSLVCVHLLHRIPQFPRISFYHISCTNLDRPREFTFMAGSRER